MPTPFSPQQAVDAAATEPVQLSLSAGGYIVGIAWADGHHSTYGAWYLRGLCPCAVCQGHGQATAFVADAEKTALADVLEVGHYALNLVWQDGHRTGIYALETLRRLCPCAACRLRQGAEHPFALVPKALQGRDPTADNESEAP